jgi:hypothetical protein
MTMTICGKCEANNIMVLLTKFMPPSLNMQVALAMGIVKQFLQASGYYSTDLYRPYIEEYH